MCVVGRAGENDIVHAVTESADASRHYETLDAYLEAESQEDAGLVLKLALLRDMFDLAHAESVSPIESAVRGTAARQIPCRVSRKLRRDSKACVHRISLCRAVGGKGSASLAHAFVPREATLSPGPANPGVVMQSMMAHAFPSLIPAASSHPRCGVTLDAERDEWLCTCRVAHGGSVYTLSRTLLPHHTSAVSTALLHHDWEIVSDGPRAAEASAELLVSLCRGKLDRLSGMCARPRLAEESTNLTPSIADELPEKDSRRDTHTDKTDGSIQCAAPSSEPPSLTPQVESAGDLTSSAPPRQEHPEEKNDTENLEGWFTCQNSLTRRTLTR